jgi:hypothetical protein
MKKTLLILIILVFFIGCDSDSKGRILIVAVDAPPPQDLEHIYLTVNEVRVKNSDGRWIAVNDYLPFEIDILRLVNGVSAILCYENIEPGHYTDVLIELADTNYMYIDGDQYLLIVSSDAKAGVVLSQEFTVVKDESAELLVDFEVSNSIDWTSEPYKLNPTFRIYEVAQYGSVAGTVKDTSDVGIQNALCMATTLTDTLTTLTDSDGEYILFLMEGAYDISVSAEGYTTSDTVYAGVYVDAGSNLTGYNFICEQ